MTTKDILKQMEKELYEFIASSPPNYPSVWKSLIRSRLRTLLESFGEEVINNDEDIVPIEYVNDADHIKAIYINLLRLVRNNQRKMQRLKVKEIIEEVGK